jgi:Fe-Mn family superoxide dismutase
MIMNRRHFLAAGGAAVAGSVLSPTVASAADAFSLTQAPLPYAPEALEPHIDVETMKIHYGKHHVAYITNLNKALTDNKVSGTDALELIKNLGAVPAVAMSAIRNNGGGHVNHTLFWQWMAPAGSGPKGPEGKLGEAIQGAYGSIDDFKKVFAEAGTKRFGSGWAWLIVKDDGKLAVTSTPNQDNPWMKGVVPDSDLGTPILGLDVWEHAYYLKYQNKRPDYITAWWNVVNWGEVARRYAAAKA